MSCTGISATLAMIYLPMGQVIIILAELSHLVVPHHQQGFLLVYGFPYGLWLSVWFVAFLTVYDFSYSLSHSLWLRVPRT